MVTDGDGELVAVIDKVRRFWAAGGYPELRGPVLTGFSGGADSTALVLVLQALGVAQRVVHFDHGLRAASGADAAWCREFCEVRGLDCEVRKLAVGDEREAGESIEMAARRLRLAAWAQLSAAAGGVPVVLGHHQDDVVETMLLRLLRGANSSGLTGLRPCRVVDGLTVWRPLLGVDRSEIEAFLEFAGVTEVCVDESNADPAFRRNRVRGELLPLLRELGDGDGGLRRTAALLLADAKVLEEAGAGDEELSVTDLREMPEALRLRALRGWARAVGVGDLVLPVGTVRDLHRALSGEGDERRCLALADGRWLVMERDRLAVVATVAEPAAWEPLRWRWREKPELELPTGAVLRASVMTGAELGVDHDDGVCFDAAAMPAELVVRARAPGDRMVPFGATASVRVKKLLANTGLTRAERERAALIVRPDSDEVLWLAPFRRGAGAPVAAATQETVRLTMRHEDGGLRC